MAEEKPVQNPSIPNDRGLPRPSSQEQGEVVAVNILGNEIRLRTQVGSVYIQKLAGDVESRVKRCMSEAGIASSLKAVIFVCLDLADELEKEKKLHLKGDKIWEERIDKLVNKIPLI